MVPKVAFPLATPFTVQTTLVSLVPVTSTVIFRVELTERFWAEVGAVIVIPTPGEIVTLRDALLLVSATLVTVMLKVAVAGTAVGA